MNTKNVAIALLTLTTVGGAALAWRQHQQLTALRASTLAASDRAELQKRIWDLQKTNRSLQDQLAALRSSRPNLNPEDRAVTSADAEAEGNRGPGIGRGRGAQFAALREALSKPEVQAMITTARKFALDAQYAALFRALNLSPEQADKLKTLLLERQNTFMDVMTAAREQGLDPRSDPQGLRKLVTDAQNAVNESIKGLLGDSGYSEFANYEQTIPQRNVVATLQQRLSTSDTPLTNAQAEQLVQILSANSPNVPATAPSPSHLRTTAPAADPAWARFWAVCKA